jgi:hypothetical protein
MLHVWCLSSGVTLQLPAMYQNKYSQLLVPVSLQLSHLHLLRQCVELTLTFKNHVSYIQDRHTATLQMLHFVYLFNKYKY